MFVTLAGTFTTRKLAIPMAASPLEPHLKQSLTAGTARSAASARTASLSWNDLLLRMTQK